jgi:adenylate cyclase
MLETVKDLAGEINLDTLLQRIIAAVTDLLDAKRSSLFLYDPKAGELFSRVAEGVAVKEIRFPSDEGIAGHVFTSGRGEKVENVYDDPRFNPMIDRATGFVTTSMLCMPIRDKSGEVIGIVQALNKRDGMFTERDESRLDAFTAQLSLALQNAHLFDGINSAKVFNDNILKSLSSGVATFDATGRATSANGAASKIIGQSVEWLTGKTVAEIFEPVGQGKLVPLILDAGGSTGSEILTDRELKMVDGARVSVNLIVSPLLDATDQSSGFMISLEDITQEKRLKSTMVRYMTNEAAEKMVETGEVSFGGTPQTATVLFSDIRGGAAVFEDYDARDTVVLLNEYYASMVDVVMKHGGMLDKHIGNAVMAVFGAPFPGEDDALKAVTAANDMMRALNGMNVARVKNGQSKILSRVGLNTGELISGNIGAANSMDYAIVGDSVNLATQLEDAANEYGVQILLGHATMDAVQGAGLKIRELDIVRLKGENQPVPIFEALDHYDDTSFPNMDAVVDAFNNGVNLYRNRDWKKAMSVFSGSLKIYADDAPSRLYLERCLRYMANPPPEDWDGVWIMTV